MENNRVKRILQRQKQREKRKRMMLAAAALAAGVVITGFAVAGVRGVLNSDKEAGATGAEVSDASGALASGTVSESDKELEGNAEALVFPKGSSAGHVDLSGLTLSQAENRMDEAFHWELKVTDGENQAQVPDYLAGWLTGVKTAMQSGTMPKADQLQPDYTVLDGKMKEFAAELAGQWNRQPVNSQAESYDRTTGVYTYSQASSGRTLNQEALADSLSQAVQSGNLDAVITAEFTEQPPERDSRQAKEQYQVIGSFTTKTTENKNRNQNIQLAVEAIDGTVLKPGEEFSFNLATGNRTSEKGYQPAGAYKNGVLIEEPGGGVCQVSTTLYHAIIESGYRTTERNAHSFAPSYVEKGQDAMVSFDGYAGPDLKFVNTGKASVVLRASFSNRQLKMSIVGLPLLDEGVEVSIRSEKVRDVEPGTPSYEENTSLPYGTEKTLDSGAGGSVWKSYRVIKKNGEVIAEEPLHNSSYKAKAPVIERNTTDASVTGTENPSAAGADGQAGVQNPAAGGQSDAQSPSGTNSQADTQNPSGSGDQANAQNPSGADGQANAQNPSDADNQANAQNPSAGSQPGAQGPSEELPLIQPYGTSVAAEPGGG